MDIEKYKESMPRCKDCTGFGWGECKTAGENEVACKDFERKPKLTNADRIRQMTDDEELLSAIGTGCYRCVYNNGECDSGYGEGCISGNLEWLRKEANEEDAETDR